MHHLGTLFTLISDDQTGFQPPRWRQKSCFPPEVLFPTSDYCKQWWYVEYLIFSPLGYLGGTAGSCGNSVPPRRTANCSVSFFILLRNVCVCYFVTLSLLLNYSLPSRTQLSDFTFTFHFHALEEEMATPVFLPGESQGRGSLVGCRLWGRTESDTTEATQQQQQRV